MQALLIANWIVSNEISKPSNWIGKRITNSLLSDVMTEDWVFGTPYFGDLIQHIYLVHPIHLGGASSFLPWNLPGAREEPPRQTLDTALGHLFFPFLCSGSLP